MVLNLLTLALVFSAVQTASLDINLERYNDWDLPFSIPMNITQQNSNPKNNLFPNGFYNLVVDFNSWLTVVFTDAMPNNPTDTVYLHNSTVPMNGYYDLFDFEF